MHVCLLLWVKRNLERLESCDQVDVEMNPHEDKGGCARCIALQGRIALATSQLKTIHEKGINLVCMYVCMYVCMATI